MHTKEKLKKTDKTFTRGGRTIRCTEIDTRLFRARLPFDTPEELIDALAKMAKEKHSGISRARPRKSKKVIMMTTKRKRSVKSNPRLMEDVALDLLSHINGRIPAPVPQSALSREDEAPQGTIKRPQTMPVPSPAVI